MGKIAFIRAVAFICSIVAKILGIPFVLLAKLLHGIASLLSLCRQRGEARRERRKERKRIKKEERQHRKEQRQLKKDQKWQLRLERRKLKEKTRERRPRKKRKKRDYSPLINKLRDKYHDTKIVGILRVVYAVGIFFVKVYWLTVILFQKLYWTFHGLFLKIYWMSHGLFQRAYWVLRGLFLKLCWGARRLIQKLYWGCRSLLQKTYWFSRGLLQKGYWFSRGLLQKGYWKFYYPKSRKLFQTLCKNPYMNLFFVFLRGNLDRSANKISCVRILGIWEYMKLNKLAAQYHVMEAGKMRPVCIPAYFEKGEKKVECFQSPDIYLAEIPNVHLIGGSNVVVAGNTLLNDSVYYDKDNRIDIRYSAIKDVFNGIAVIEDPGLGEEIERGINLVGATSFNYYHLIVEILSKLAFVDSYETYWDYPLLVDEVVLRIPQFHSALECINSLKHPVVEIGKGKKYLVKDMVQPSSNVWMPTNVYKRDQMRVGDFMIADTVLNNVRSSVGVWQERPAWRKIFVSRKNTQTVRLKNEEEVRNLFAQNGFEIVYTEEMSFRQQVECFGQAKCVVAATGAALTNMIFCQSETLIGCIIPAQDNFCMYSTIGYLLGLKLLFLDAEIVELTPYVAADTFRLDLNYVERYIKSIQKIL